MTTTLDDNELPNTLDKTTMTLGIMTPNIGLIKVDLRGVVHEHNAVHNLTRHVLRSGEEVPLRVTKEGAFAGIKKKRPGMTFSETITEHAETLAAKKRKKKDGKEEGGDAEDGKEEDDAA